MTTFIDAINAAIQEHRPGSRGLSRTQRWWLGICLMGIMVTNGMLWILRTGAGWRDLPGAMVLGAV